MIEFCCSHDSKLCTPREASKGCRLIRVTENEDGTTKGCRNWLAQEIQSFRESNPQGEVLLYASLPCVGGSPWGYINAMTDTGAERIEQQQKEFTKLFKLLQSLIQQIDGPHFSIAFELSKNCKYWKPPLVQSFLKKNNLKQYPFHGCQFGVTGLEGNPMKKGWMIATNMEELSGLSEYVCDGSHTDGQSRGTALKLAAGMPVEAAGERARREVLASHASTGSRTPACAPLPCAVCTNSPSFQCHRQIPQTVPAQRQSSRFLPMNENHTVANSFLHGDSNLDRAISSQTGNILSLFNSSFAEVAVCSAT